jgi:coenzyme F420-reducing hydrogenase alpha subunit
VEAMSLLNCRRQIHVNRATTYNVEAMSLLNSRRQIHVNRATTYNVEAMPLLNSRIMNHICIISVSHCINSIKAILDNRIITNSEEEISLILEDRSYGDITTARCARNVGWNNLSSQVLEEPFMTPQQPCLLP